MDAVRLQNAEEVAAEHDTFEILPREERENILPGQQVQLAFLLPENKPKGAPNAERMWVYVRGREQHLGVVMYHGILNNDPAFLKMRSGIDLQFGPEHILKVWNEERE